MSTTFRRREGFALPLALIALVLIGALVTASTYSAFHEGRTARGAAAQARALAAAEHAQDTIFVGWNKQWNSFAPGTTFVRQFTEDDGTVATVRITKLNALSYLIASEGRTGGADSTGSAAAARRRTGLLMRLDVPVMKVGGAITTAGVVTIGGAATLIGRDTSIATWGCPAAGAPVAGAAITDYSKIAFGGTCKPIKGGGYTCIDGSPLVDTSSVYGQPDTYFDYGGVSWEDLVLSADKIVTGALTNVQPSYIGVGTAACNVGDLRNWGEPLKTPLLPGDCETYYPIVYAPSSIAINGNRGQGILLVNGNLEVQGNFEFYGQIITRGTLKLTGTGNKITGSVMAAAIMDSTKESTMLGGTSTIRYSRCVLNTVSRSAALPARARERGWAELF